MKPSKPVMDDAEEADDSIRVTPYKYKCPFCKHPSNRSRARGWERLFRVMGFIPRRCRNCSRRFLSRAGSRA